MVLKGQFLERPTLIPVGAQVCEGLWHRGTREPPLLILPPVPSEGSMDHVVLAELAWTAARAGHPELRFNLRGVGASQGAPSSDEKAWLPDANAALELVLENTEAKGALVVALGPACSVALSLAQTAPKVAALALVNPPAALFGAKRFHGVLFVFAAEEHARDEPALAEQVVAQQGRFVRIAGADKGFKKSLSDLGRAFADALAFLCGDPPAHQG